MEIPQSSTIHQTECASNPSPLYTAATNIPYDDRQPTVPIPVILSNRHTSIPRKRTSATKPQDAPLRENNIRLYLKGSEAIHIGYLNTQSCCNKLTDVNNLISESHADLFFFTETWLRTKGDKSKIKALTPRGYDFKSMPRDAKHRSGGIGVAFKSSLATSLLFHPVVNDFNTFEWVSVTLSLQGTKIKFICIYRISPSSKNTIAPSAFRGDFHEFLASQRMNSNNLVIVGDFNLHYDQMTADVLIMDQSFKDHNMVQHVEKPTQKKGHILDWVVTNDDLKLRSPVTVSDKLISDHFPIEFQIEGKKLKPDKKVIAYRDLKRVNMEDLRSDLGDELNDKTMDIESFNSTLVGTLDRHAPVKTKSTAAQIRPSPWYNDEIRLAKQEKRRAESKWVKTRLTVDKEIFAFHKRKYNELCNEAKRSYYNSKFNDVHNSRDFFRLTDDLLGNERNSSLPSQLPKEDLPNAFSEFFVSKIDTIRKELEDIPAFVDNRTFTGSEFQIFDMVTEDTVKEVIMSSPSKSCELDPFPTQLLKQCIDVILPSLTVIINDSLRSGVVPNVLKLALVRPLLKKDNLDPEQLKNFRPVSNLSFLSKILEKLVLRQLLSHLNDHSLLQPYQSAYRANHSTETALTRVVNDLLNIIDNGSVSLLNLLDLSAAFDTIDHVILIRRLHEAYGISGTVLSWFKSYITNRRQTVVIDNLKSDETCLRCGVPQGSVLGPILFVLYTSPLCQIFNDFDMAFHLYADDTQIYSVSKNMHLDDIIRKSEECISVVKEWMDGNRLKLNNDKTEVLKVASKRISEKYVSDTITIGGNEIQMLKSVKNLGIMLDSDLSMTSQVNSLVKSLSFSLRNISSIRPFLTADATKRLVISLLFSRLDYCNTLLFGVPEVQIRRLQVIQNNAARMVLKRPKYASATEMLKELHWLPVSSRIEYKAAALVFKCLEGSAPQYLIELLKIYNTSRNLRSSDDKTRLEVPRIRLNAGKRAFSYFGPHLWNSLPQSVRESSSLDVFKKKLKTYLFREEQ